MMETPLVHRQDSVGSTSPEEKMRNRLAAEVYRSFENANNNSNKYETKYSSQTSSSSWSHKEKKLCVATVVLALVAVVMTVLFIVQLALYTKNQTCMDPDCVLNSALLLEKMDLTADPCEDFNQYVCGNYFENTQIPPDKAKWGAFNELDQKNKARLKRILDTPGNSYRGSNSTAIGKAKRYYKACMNETMVEERKGDPALELINAMGSWPMTSDDLSGTWSSDEFDLVEMLTYANLHGATPFFGFGVGQDEHNSSLNIIAIDQGGTIFADRKFYLGNDSTRYHEAYTQYFVDIVVLLGGERAAAVEMADNLWEFESRLAEFQDTQEQRTDYDLIYHRMSAEEAAVNITAFNLLDFLNGIFTDLDQDIGADEPVIVYNPEFLAQMSQLIEDTDNSVLCSYMVWHVVRTTVPYLSSDFQRARQSANALLDGVTTMPDQWLTCVSTAESSLNLATGAMYVEKYFSPQDKRHAREMVSYIRESFRSSLPDVSWMDVDTRDRALQKVDAIIEKIGYPDLIDDVEKLDQYYQSFEVDQVDSFQNMLNSVDFYTKKALAKLHAAVDKTEWHMAADEVNAYYNANNNEIVFPAGILQQPFYSPHFPMAMNFGAIGMVIGHELTHGFDNTGRQFDGNGNLNNWWQNSSLRQFEERTECLANQYGHYTVEGEEVNGHTTLGENIADNGGLKTSFAAYQSWLDNNHHNDPGVKLPGVELSPEQLYFVGFAQLWCTFTTPEYAVQALVTDPHSPAKYRIIGAVSNSAEFAEAFSCPRNSAMNPNDKCTVW